MRMATVGDRRRESVLETATHVASAEGLEGLTLGRLADAAGQSKSSLQSLFGTKEALQLAIIEAAVQVWRSRVLVPAESQPDGLPRLRALMNAWIDYLEVFDGGCVFIAGAAELDSTTGAVRDALAAAVTAGQKFLRREAALAVRLGELPVDTDVDVLVFQLHALLLKANHDRQLFGARDALRRAHQVAAALLT